MVKIEVEHGTYEGETLEAAQKLLRKGERQARKDYELSLKRHDQAQQIANAKAYQAWMFLHRHQHEGSSMPRWSVKLPGSEYFRVKLGTDSFYKLTTQYTYDTETGRVVVDHYRDEVLGVVWNGGGWDIVTFIKNHHDEKVRAFSIGVWEGQFALSEIPGLELKHFERD